MADDDTDEPAVVRTSVVLPEGLWLRAKALAAGQRRDLRALIIEGLEKVLAEGKPNTEAARVRERVRMVLAQSKLRAKGYASKRTKGAG